jgi:hypothetical protein
LQEVINDHFGRQILIKILDFPKWNRFVDHDSVNGFLDRDQLRDDFSRPYVNVDHRNHEAQYIVEENYKVHIEESDEPRARLLNIDEFKDVQVQQKSDQ